MKRETDSFSLFIHSFIRSAKNDDGSSDDVSWKQVKERGEERERGGGELL